MFVGLVLVLLWSHLGSCLAFLSSLPGQGFCARPKAAQEWVWATPDESLDGEAERIMRMTGRSERGGEREQSETEEGSVEEAEDSNTERGPITIQVVPDGSPSGTSLHPMEGGGVLGATLFPNARGGTGGGVQLKPSCLEPGNPAECCGFWELDSAEVGGVNGEVDSQPSDRLILRVDGQVAGGPVISKVTAEWSDPQGVRSAGGRWEVYTDDAKKGVSRLRVSLFGDQKRTMGLRLDGVVLACLEYDERSGGNRSVLRAFGDVTHVRRKGKTLETKVRGEFSMVKLATDSRDLFESVGGVSRLW
ncbi:unnamed protein product [Chrysoparadoxa australica]